MAEPIEQFIIVRVAAGDAATTSRALGHLRKAMHAASAPLIEAGVQVSDFGVRDADSLDRPVHDPDYEAVKALFRRGMTKWRRLAAALN